MAEMMASLDPLVSIEATFIVAFKVLSLTYWFITDLG
jgi:hypothetical protein